MADIGASSAARVGNSVLGVDKAYFLFHKKAVNTISDEWEANEMPKNLQAEEKLKWKANNKQYENEFKALAQQVGNYGAGLSNLSTNADRLETVSTNQTEADGFIPIKVQYNPSTLQFVSRGGKSVDRYSGVGGSGTFQIMNVPYEIMLYMDLIFDETVNSNAFSTFDSSNVGSVSGIANSIKTGILGNLNSSSELAANKGKRYSVQNISELFVAAIAHPYTRMVCVVWNKTIFWGEITGVNVEYTMFNRDGDPIRSKVHVEIRQDDRFDSSSASKDWEKTYDTLFEAGNKLAQKATYSSSSAAENVTGQKTSGTTFQQNAKFVASNIFHL